MAPSINRKNNSAILSKYECIPYDRKFRPKSHLICVQRLSKISTCGSYVRKITTEQDFLYQFRELERDDVK